MSRIRCLIHAWILACLVLGICFVPANAENTEIGFAVRALLPDNQLDNDISYFYLDVKPGQTQSLHVQVVNRGDEDIEVALEANTAFTNRNGIIEYTASHERDDSLVVDFSQCVFIGQPILTVPKQGSATAEFLLTMPEQPFEGDVLGGLRFTKLPPAKDDHAKLDDGEETQAPAGMSIQNVYTYAIAVRLSENVAAPQSEPRPTLAPRFELMDAEVGELAGLPILTMRIRNPQPLIAKEVSLQAHIYPQGASEPVLSFAQTQLAMAPNSVMPYTRYLEPDEVLPAGPYRVELELMVAGQTWTLQAPLSSPGAL